MSGKTFKRQVNPVSMIALAALLATAGCDESGEFKMPSLGAGASSDGADGLAGNPAVKLVERDVEAPEVFSVSENGLWDGRPSLGGVWVAHPDVTDPERVIIRNPSNDEFVVGALFRRERENPGPALQVSSDAAAELGMLAGSPNLLSVVALRKEETPLEPAEATATAELEAPPAVEATPLDASEAADPVANAAAIAIAAAAAADEAPAVTPAPASTPAAAPAPAPAPVTSSLDKPFIQIGIFSIEANANRTGNMLRTDGLVPTIREEDIRGKTIWRVIVGPSLTADDRATVLSKAKALGFTDAYAVRN